MTSLNYLPALGPGSVLEWKIFHYWYKENSDNLHHEDTKLSSRNHLLLWRHKGRTGTWRNPAQRTPSPEKNANYWFLNWLKNLPNPRVSALVPLEWNCEGLLAQTQQINTMNRVWNQESRIQLAQIWISKTLKGLRRRRRRRYPILVSFVPI